MGIGSRGSNDISRTEPLRIAREICRVKPDLKTTFEYRPPVHNDHYFEVTFGTFITQMISEQRPSVNNGLFLCPKFD